MALNEKAVVDFLHHVADSVHWRSSEVKDNAKAALDNVVDKDEFPPEVDEAKAEE